MISWHSGEYNRDQWISFRAIEKVCESLNDAAIEQLKASFTLYLRFRQNLDAFHLDYFTDLCDKLCFSNGLSACCGFESIITFFADQVIAYLLSQPEQRAALFQVLEQPNRTEKCVFLGASGCIWPVRPISCAMFFCGQGKQTVFSEHPEAEVRWKELQNFEKEFTWPTQPVLFDEIEKYFVRLGVASPHLYFHQSPGLLRLKAKARLR